MPYDIAHAVRVVWAGIIAREHNYAGVFGYGILEHHVDEPLRLAGAVYSVGVGITPGECRQSHAAVIVRVEAACTVSTGQVDCIHIV